MTIEIRGIAGDRVLHAFVARQLRALAARLRLKPIEAEANFVDVNGPKGGVDIRCGLTVRLPRRPTLHAEHLAPTARLAFDGGLVALERQLARYGDRERELRRRPKKYFVAKALLEGRAPAVTKRRKAS